MIIPIIFELLPNKITIILMRAKMKIEHSVNHRPQKFQFRAVLERGRRPSFGFGDDLQNFFRKNFLGLS